MQSANLCYTAIMRLLVIDDNAALGWRLQSYMHKQFAVDVARTGEEGLHTASITHYGVIILDLGLPDMDGQEVCQKLRPAGIATPIIILSAEAATTSKVRLLESGADDYLTKPFEPSELLARVKALIRRHEIAQDQSPVLQVRDLAIDTNRRIVTRGGTPIPLRRKEFEILEYLGRNRGTIVTQDMIIDHVWHELDRTAWANTVRVHIKHLRDKIDRPFDVQLIKTAHGIGYIIVE